MSVEIIKKIILENKIILNAIKNQESFTLEDREKENLKVIVDYNKLYKKWIYRIDSQSTNSGAQWTKSFIEFLIESLDAIIEIEKKLKIDLKKKNGI